MALTNTRLFKSTDPGAPVLTGQNGSLIALLKACLVGTAGVAYGSGASAKPSAGWTTAFEDAPNNKIAFRNSLAAGGSGCYVRIDDNASGAGGALEAYEIAYASMSDINTGTDPAPTTAQMARGAVIRKSQTADSTARSWVLVADELTYWLSIRFDSTSYWGYWFGGGGDFRSHVPGDPYNYQSVGWMAENAGNSTHVAPFSTGSTSLSGAATGIWLGRNYAAAPGAVAGVIYTLFASSAFYKPVGGIGAPLPSVALGSAARYFDSAIVAESGTIRGALRGLYVPANDLSALPQGVILSGMAGLPVDSRFCTMPVSNSPGAGFGSDVAGLFMVESSAAL